MEISIIPRRLIRYLSNDYFHQNDINILISNFLIILIIILFRQNLILFLNQIPHFCLVDRLFGIVCPFCGTTRAFCELAKGNINEANHYNIAGIFLATFFVLQIPLRLISLVIDCDHEKINLISKYLGYGILILIVINWILNLIYL